MALPLHAGRGDMLTEVSGTAVFVDVDVDERQVITVDHSADAVFAFAEPPRFAAILDGTTVEAIVRVLSSGTDGGQFVCELYVEATCTTETDLGHGGADPDWEVAWTRRGILE